MKKNILFVLFMFLVMFLTVGSVSALDFNEEGYYVNYFNIEMTEKNVSNLLGLGFTEQQIYYMQREEFDNNKDIEGEIVSQTTKYYKTEVFEIPEIMTYSLSSEPLSRTVEITEEEYYNDSEISILASDTVTTEYKRMTTTIAKAGSYYRYKNDLSWRKLPKTRSYDVISIGMESDLSIVPTSYNFSAITDYDDAYNGICGLDIITNPTWSKSANGAAARFKLFQPNDGQTVKSMSSSMYYDVQKRNSTTLYVINAYGNYKHAQRTVEPNYSFGVSIPSFEISIGASPAVVESFDSMSTAHAAYYLTW